MEVVDAIRRLASVEKQPTQAAPAAQLGAAFTVNVQVEGVAPEKRVPAIDLKGRAPALTRGE